MVAALRADVRVRGSLFGRVEEPATLVTDLVLAAVSGYWATLLIGAGADRGDAGMATVIWGAAFIATALAAALGGVVHGFQERMGPRYARPLWRATLHSIALASAAMLAAAFLVFADPSVRAAGLAVVALKLLAASALLVVRPEFKVALIDHGIALAGVLALQLAAASTHGAASAPWIIGGIAVSALAAAIQALRISPHPRFNHNDLYHIVQIGALWLLYRGGLLLVAG